MIGVTVTEKMCRLVETKLRNRQVTLAKRVMSLVITTVGNIEYGLLPAIPTATLLSTPFLSLNRKDLSGFGFDLTQENITFFSEHCVRRYVGNFLLL